jgi:glutaconyl-CoA/methylmalonyl-CoA decarboxylase subunit gamma
MKTYKYKINDNLYEVKIKNIKDTVADVEVNGKQYKVEMEEAPVEKPVIEPVKAESVEAVDESAVDEQQVQTVASSGKGKGIKTPLPGVIVDVKVRVGDSIKKGQTVVVLEAMKMENNINATCDGKVVAVNVKKGDSVSESTDLVIIE